jgi:SPASM domain peptide maturase of grasp-with-spasm system
MNMIIKNVDECPTVKGFFRSAIYDLNRNAYDLIPNSLYEIMKEYEGQSIDKLRADWSNEPILDEYLNFLINNEYIFYCDKKEFRNFPKLNFNFHYPAIVSSAIINIEEHNCYDELNSIIQLEDLGCKHLTLISEKICGLEYFDSLLNKLIDSSILTVEIYTKYDPQVSFHNIQTLNLKHRRIRSIVLHTAPENKTFTVEEQLFGLIVHSCEAVNIFEDKRGHLREYFNVNMQSFSEAQTRNLYFNQKIFINIKGDISGTPISSELGLNVKDISIAQAVETQGFKKYWTIHKEMIEVCKDCEFRFMCPDDRLPFKDTDNKWKHTSECFYNPYLGKWKGDENYKSLSETEEYLALIG